mgnify:FL=1
MADSRKEKRMAELKDRLLDRYRKSGVAPILEEVVGTFVANLAYRQTEGEDFRILGVEPGDPPELMEKVWRVKALFYHPDVPKTGNREAYERVKAAYDRLKGEER